MSNNSSEFTCIHCRRLNPNSDSVIEDESLVAAVRSDLSALIEDQLYVSGNIQLVLFTSLPFYKSNHFVVND